MADEVDDVAAIRRSNRRTIVALGVVVLIFAAPLLYALGRYLLSLL